MDKAKTTQVIGIASGKGGVGKTTVSVNLAVALQAMGHRVMLFDADMSLANAQIALGCRCPYNLSHFLSGEKTLAEIIVTTRQGVKLVPGASGIQEMAALGDAHQTDDCPHTQTHAQPAFAAIPRRPQTPGHQAECA